MPLAVLLSSIMTFGNLGENYELAAMKSSGLSLFRIMRPMLYFIFLLAVFCFAFSNYMLPFINLKAGSLLYDVRSAKQGLNLQEGIFYSGIDGYTIRIGKKDPDGKTIHNILIYDHTEGRGNIIQNYAEDGEISISDDKRFLTIILRNGRRYQQLMDEERHKYTRPNMYMSYHEQIVKIDLSGFKLEKTEEGLFKDNAEMMDLVQLNRFLDSAKSKTATSYAATTDQFKSNFFIKSFSGNTKPSEKINITLEKYLQAQNPQTRNNILESALNLSRSYASFMDSKVNEENSFIASEAKIATQWHQKFTVSFACIILFFVGAPLGAIVRKGGFGMPVVISVILFIIYHVLSFSCLKMVLSNKLALLPGMWLAPFVFLPFGLWLTLKASNDSPLFDALNFNVIENSIFKLFRKEKNNRADTASL